MNNEIYLKTAFCCMTCDGEIATEEIKLIKDYITNNNLFEGLNVEDLLNDYIEAINQKGKTFLLSYLNDLRNEELTTEQELQIIRIAIEMIEADNEILYSEVKFFKKLRAQLKIDDETILEYLPDKEDYLLPDINQEEYEYDSNNQFAKINIPVT